MSKKTPIPPVAARKPNVRSAHGQSWNDDWFWLREKENPEVLAYLRAENAYTEEILAPTRALQETIVREIRGRIRERDQSAPTKDGPYRYYTRFEEGAEYPVYCRVPVDGDREEVLLDLAELARGKPYCDIGVFEYSPDHKWLAYSIDEDGSERYRLHFKNLATGEVLAESIPGTHPALEWAADSATVFYVKLDEQLRPLSVWRHGLGHDPASDPLVYREEDPRFFLSVHKSLSGRFVFIHARGSHVTETRFIPADRPEEEPVLIEPRAEGVEYSVTEHENEFFIRTNRGGAKDFEIVKAPVSQPGAAHWKTVVPHEAGTLITSVECFKDYLVLERVREGLGEIWIRAFAGGDTHLVGFEEEVYDVDTGGYREYHSPLLRFSYSSFVTPNSVFDYDMRTRERTLVKQQEVPGGYDAGRYRTKREWAIAADGRRIPISLFHLKETPLDGTAPLYLYGYGAYGISRPAGFSVARPSLVDRGFVYAIAHVRGGMEMGWDWYEEGKLAHKSNTFTDFIACAEHLARKKYTAAGNIVACGGSAGGMLMGAVANMRPDLFRAIVAHVPFVDVLNTMLDETLPLTPIEYREWGNPAEREVFDRIRSYSPYDQVTAQDYPHLFVTGGLNDPRVTYWEPAKWVAKLRATKTDSNLLCLKIHMGFGHSGASGRFEYLKEIAEEYAFILNVFGKA